MNEKGMYYDDGKARRIPVRSGLPMGIGSEAYTLYMRPLVELGATDRRCMGPGTTGLWRDVEMTLQVSFDRAAMR